MLRMRLVFKVPASVNLSVSSAQFWYFIGLFTCTFTCDEGLGAHKTEPDSADKLAEDCGRPGGCAVVTESSSSESIFTEAADSSFLSY